MLDFIRGKVDYVGEGFVVVENNNIGYKIKTSSHTIYELNKDKEDIIIYTEMVVREDDISLYGFSTRKELQVFELLTTVNGVGPKVAIGILSAIRFIDIVNIILQGDVNTLTKAPGVGKKTAQRIILELKDKIQKKVDINPEESNITISNIINSDHNEAVDALVSLGYTRNEAKGVLGKIDTNLPIEEVIKQALKLLMK